MRERQGKAEVPPVSEWDLSDPWLNCNISNSARASDVVLSPRSAFDLHKSLGRVLILLKRKGNKGKGLEEFRLKGRLCAHL